MRRPLHQRPTQCVYKCRRYRQRHPVTGRSRCETRVRPRAGQGFGVGWCACVSGSPTPWLTYAIRWQCAGSFSLARHSRRRFCLEKLPCQPLPRMRCAACFLPHSAVLPHVSSSLSAYHNAAERSNRMHLSWDEVLASHTRQSSITRRSCITCCGRLPLLFGTDICI